MLNRISTKYFLILWLSMFSAAYANAQPAIDSIAANGIINDYVGTLKRLKKNIPGFPTPAALAGARLVNPRPVYMILLNKLKVLDKDTGILETIWEKQGYYYYEVRSKNNSNQVLAMIKIDSATKKARSFGMKYMADALQNTSYYGPIVLIPSLNIDFLFINKSGTYSYLPLQNNTILGLNTGVSISSQQLRNIIKPEADGHDGNPH